MLPRGRVRHVAFVLERAVEVEEMAQRDRVCHLELAQLLRIRRVRRFAVRDRERSLPGSRPDAEGGLEPRVAPLAEHRRACEPFLGDALPAEADLVARAERLE